VTTRNEPCLKREEGGRIRRESHGEERVEVGTRRERRERPWLDAAASGSPGRRRQQDVSNEGSSESPRQQAPHGLMSRGGAAAAARSLHRREA
jgi:hypothetical protein